MNNKVIKTLLDKVKEFEYFFNEYEKQFYPKVIKIRNLFLVSLIVFIILMLTSYVLWFWNFGDLCVKIVSLIFTVLSLGGFIYLSRKFDKISDGKPNKFEELCREIKYELILMYGEKASYAVKLLIADLTDKQDNKIKKYESLVKSVGIVGIILVTAFITLALNKLFVADETAISVETFLGLILIVAIIVWLINFIDSGIKNIIKYPIWGKASKEVYLIDILYEVKYMVLEKENIMTKRVLISVSDKAGIVEFAQELKKLGWEIISTGGTKVALDNAGVDTIAIDDVTGFPEMMDGRVKTLHPNIHGGLLARRDLDSHLEAAKDNKIELIDLVVVSLYPFKETILKPDVTYADAVENIDIGGPSMLRSAAKNHASVTVVVDPADYAVVLDELAANGETSYETRQRLAAKVFRHTAAYDALIAEYFTAQVGESKPEKLTLTYDLKQPMRYGENPQQDADFYQKALPTDYSIASAKQLNGKELSFNNIRDADAAIRIIRDFKDRPTVVALKHMNPCGIGQADDIETAWDYAYESDPVSIFGGIVVLNRELDVATAEKMHGVFLEIIIAPSYTDEALAILTNKKKNLRILALPFDAQEASEVEAEYTGVVGGLLVQNQDVVKESPADWQVVTKRQPTETEATALEFAWKAIKYVKSNGIIVTNDHMTLGVGPGQTNRVASVRIAIDQAKDRLDGAVLASDAFFPFADNVEEIAKAGIRAIIQPGGSVRDQESIEAADKYGLTMVFTGVRHFRH